jgi:hypothetical protein
LIALVDIDNTISDARWRDPWVGDWDLFYSHGIYDCPVLPMVRMVNALSRCGDTIVHLTGRPERWRDLTLTWMVRHGVRTDRRRGEGPGTLQGGWGGHPLGVPRRGSVLSLYLTLDMLGIMVDPDQVIILDQVGQVMSGGLS